MSNNLFPIAIQQLMLNDIAPNSASLGTLNALALTCATGLKAICPALFASIFATGARTQIMDGYFIWFIMVLLGLGLVAAVQGLPEKVEGKYIPERSEE